MKTTKFAHLGVFVAFAAIVAACSSAPSSSAPEWEAKELTTEAMPAGLGCYNTMKAESSKATPDRSTIEAACSPAGAMAKGEGTDPGVIVWCDAGGCCVAQDSGTICCCWTDGTCGCG